MILDVSALLKKAPHTKPTSKVSTVYGGSNVFSVGIVNSCDNGKRVSISKSLSRKLALTDTLSVLPMVEDGVVLLARDLPFDAASNVKLSGKDKKIAYSAALVQMLTAEFDLDFSNRTSMSFTEVDFDDLNGITVAAVCLHNKNTTGSIQGNNVV